MTTIKICSNCSQPHIPWSDLTGQIGIYGGKYICDPCFRKLARIQRDAKIPREFKGTTDVDKLPDPKSYAEVQAWRPILPPRSGRGLTLYGPTGRGKSRSAWDLVSKLLSMGYDVEASDSLGIEKISLAYGTDHGLWDITKRFMEAQVLYLDDPFKVKLTERCQSVIYRIIDMRVLQQIPTIISCNDVGDTLAARMTPDVGPALVRRISENSDPILFS